MLKIIPFSEIGQVSTIFDQHINRFDVIIRAGSSLYFALGVVDSGVQVAPASLKLTLRAPMTPDALGEFMQALGWGMVKASGNCQPFEFKLDLASMLIRQVRFVLLTNSETAETKKAALLKLANDETRYYVKGFADSVLHVTTLADDAMALSDESRECFNSIIDREMLDAETITAKQIKEGIDNLISSILDEGRTIQ